MPKNMDFYLPLLSELTLLPMVPLEWRVLVCCEGDNEYQLWL